MSAYDLLIFDMDGVLVDVTESYREAIRETVSHFTGVMVSTELIQEYKMQVGWNDDWALSYHLIRNAGIDVAFESVVSYFQQVFRGETGYSGLIQRETWIPRDGILDRLGKRYRMAIFTGRFNEEARVTLDRFAPDTFETVVSTDQLENGKPHPEGLFKICASVPHQRVFYMGDTADDASSAKAAGVPFIGIVGPDMPRREQSIEALQQLGAVLVLGSVNQLEDALRNL